MIKVIKNIYFKIICYDPIIENLYDYEKNNNINVSNNYVASPVIVNRKIKRKYKSKKINS